MLRVYLDQNQWVDLLRAASGNPEGERFVDALTLCRVASAAENVSFPLDMYRYFETAKRPQDESRHGLAHLMWQLSRRHTMSLPFPLLDRELDLALARRFGERVAPREARVFGIGMHHIAGDRVSKHGVDLSAYPEVNAVLTPGERVALDAKVEDLVEHELLSAGPATHARVGGIELAQLDFGRRFVEFENGVAKFIADKQLKGPAIDAYMRATDLGDIRPALINALDRSGLTLEQFVETLGERGMLAFANDLPTRFVTSEMRAAKHKVVGQEPWVENDFIDILCLPVAAVHCDVVVTEKRWVHRMKMAGVEQRFNTKLLTNVNELAPMLAAAA